MNTAATRLMPTGVSACTEPLKTGQVASAWKVACYEGNQPLNTCLTLQPGIECIIRALGSDKQTARRLAQMGILPGSILRIIRVAPFGETVEVSIDQGQYFALREEEIKALDCEMVAMPLTAITVKTERHYRIRALSGGKTFQQKMEKLGVVPGRVVQIRDLTTRRFLIGLIREGKTVVLGRGEADKVIIEVMDDQPG